MSHKETKKVLIITYYWPPAGGPGVQRWLKFTKYLPDFNIEPIVYVPENPTYPILDTSLSQDISPDLKILKHPINEPYKFASIFSGKKSNAISKGIIHRKTGQSYVEKLLLYVRGNFFIPDARKSWVRPSIKYLSDYLHKHSIDIVITTGPPHSMHLIGMGLKERLNINWIADFRDPWTTIGYHKKLRLTRTASQKHLYLEQQVLSRADKLIVTSNNTKNEFRLKTQTPIHVITNGYDTQIKVDPKKDGKFSLAHIGSLLSDRNPTVLWKVISELIEENLEFRKYFQLRLVGVVSKEIMESLNQFRLNDFTKIYGYLTHDLALKHQLSSSVLLLIEINSEQTKAIIPGKLFEYMNSCSPILAIGPIGSDVESLINKTATGTYFKYDEHSQLKNQILSYFEAFKSHSLKTRPIGIEEFSRKNLTKKLADLL